MKTSFRVFLLLLIGFGPSAQKINAEESLGEKIKKIFATPTPTPARKRKHSAAKKSATPSPSPKHKKTSPTPEPSASPKPKQKKKKGSATPKPTESPTPSPSPSPTPEETPSPTPSATSSPTETPSPSPSASSSEKKGEPNATISPNELSGYEDYPARVRRIIDTALDLTTRNLTYSYGSADPTNGGMDCSGFVYYVLQQNDIKDVPRDSSQQYVWVRKSGNFRAVISRNADSFELDALKPGDLLFWTGTYSIERDPPITHSMIYVGKKKGTDRRIMVGASDGRSFDGKQRYGVSVFDFKLSKPKADKDTKMSPLFVGYGRVPGLDEN